VDILIAVQMFLEMLGDSSDDASAIDLVSNHIEDVEHLVACALRQLQGPPGLPDLPSLPHRPRAQG